MACTQGHWVRYKIGFTFNSTLLKYFLICFREFGAIMLRHITTFKDTAHTFQCTLFPPRRVMSLSAKHLEISLRQGLQMRESRLSCWESTK